MDKGQEVKHVMMPERVGVVICNMWWPDQITGTYFVGVFWGDGDKTYIRPELLEKLEHGTLEFDLSEFQEDLCEGKSM